MRSRLRIIGISLVLIFPISIVQISSAVTLSEEIRSCLTKKIGIAATKKIASARNLTKAQKKHLDACKVKKSASPASTPSPSVTPIPSQTQAPAPTPSPNPSQTPAPSPSASPSSNVNVRYFQIVELPTGVKICPFVPGFDVKEFTLTASADVFGLYGKKSLNSGTKVCRGEAFWEYVTPVKPAVPLSAEAKAAVASWQEFRSKRPENKSFNLRFYIDPTGDQSVTARDYLGFMEAISVFAPELGAGKSYSVAIGYSDKFILDEVAKDYFLAETKDRVQATWATNISQGGQCYGNFWAPWKTSTSKIVGHVGDITLCNHRMGINHSPDMSHTAPHELFHGVQQALRPYWEAETLMWWSEGSAFFVGAMISADLGMLDIERNRAFWTAQLIEESTDRRLSKMNDNDNASRRAGVLAVELFISKYGFVKFLDVYKKQGELGKADPNGPGATKNFAPAFKAVTGQELSDFMVEADAYIERSVAERLKYPR